MDSHKLRIKTAFIMALAGIPALLIGSYIFYFAVAVCSWLATFELCRMHQQKKDTPKSLNYILPFFSVGMVIISMLYALVGINVLRILLIVALFIVLFCAITSLVIDTMKMSDGLFLMFYIFYPTIGFIVMGLTRSLIIPTKYDLCIGNFDFNLGGLFAFAYLLFCSMFTDIFAYVCGRKFGKNKLAPDVSPNKTIGGAIGGTVCSFIISTVLMVVIYFIFNFQLFVTAYLWQYFVIIALASIILSIISQLGDLIASKLKREYGIKDYGNIFPGHGGVMDRFDSLILTSIMFIIMLFLAGVVI